MKTTAKIISFILAVSLMCGIFSSCARDERYEAYDRTGEPYDYYLPDYIKVCDYTGIELPLVEYVPSEQDIQNRLKMLAGYYCERTEDPDRPCQKYDYVDIITSCKFTDTGETYGLFNFEKNDNGIGQTFLLGINYFGFPAIDDAVLGMSQGESKTVTLTIPDPFYKDFINSGREVEIEIYLNYIDEVDFSVVNDQFYYDHYGYYGESMNNYVVSELLKEKNDDIANYKTVLAWKYICENSKLKKVPEKEYQEEYEKALNSARSAAESQGLTLDEYILEALGYDNRDDFYAYLKKQAESICFEDMIMYYIIRCENLQYTEEFYDSAVLEMASTYDITDVAAAEDFLAYYMGDMELHEAIRIRYAKNWIVENAVIREDINQFFSDKLNK